LEFVCCACVFGDIRNTQYKVSGNKEVAYHCWYFARIHFVGIPY